MKKLLVTAVALLFGVVTLQAATPIEQLPKQIYSGEWKAGHVQGLAVDTKREYIYFSFTTMLIKMDMQGNIVGSVTGLLGHLGCIEFNDADGRIYGSLEYKDDSIGRGILKQENSNRKFDTAFYVAIFDVDKITREGMSAEKDGIMTTVYLPTVVEDFKAKVECGGKSLLPLKQRRVHTARLQRSQLAHVSAADRLCGRHCFAGTVLYPSGDLY